MVKKHRALCVMLGGVTALGGVSCHVLRGETARPSQGEVASTVRSDGSPLSTDLEPECHPTQPITITYESPANLRHTTQLGADCFAWQDFIALNWPASNRRGQPDRSAPAESFGEPDENGDFRAVVWQTYMNTSEVFQPSAQPPPPWDSEPAPPDCVPPGKGSVASHRPHSQAFIRAFTSLSPVAKFTPEAAVQAPDRAQPPGFGWLADTNSNLVWYETKINETGFDYITDAGLYDATRQWALSKQGMPGVKSPGGAVHLKAAWRQITDSNDYGRYLMTGACIPMPGGGTRWVQLGLVGLHIVHKVRSQPQWVWATFEHVDNAPSRGQAPDAGRRYSFHDEGCSPAPISPACLPDGGAARRGCDGSLPPYTLSAYFDGGADTCAPYPIQVTRETPISDTVTNPIAQLNAAVQRKIREANPRSVFQHYQLINVMWWGTPPPDNMQGGVTIPISSAGSVPLGVPVANTVLETYAQRTNCLSCHSSAAVSTAGGQGGRCGSDGGLCAADFAFLFSKAQLPADAGTGQ